MIYTLDGTPLNVALQNAAIRVAERRLMQNQRRPVYLADDKGERVYRVVHNKLGDPHRVFREVHVQRGKYDGELRRIRAERGVGRPVKTLTAPTIMSAVKMHGSQRKAAAALGISLGKLQRMLKKQRFAVA